ncbi:MAG: bifunctional precorrin-2 dehydrogenase/sirohydrochlorin ferrochelatase [Clostridiales bacterium]|nr:bifunctional precorrin-2 dehydrogenase/sirohydrochlorin ferrochelatase [Clostridiales bacterium]
MKENKDRSLYFPFFVNISQWPVLVIGGGHIASRRIRVLLEFGAKITLISPEAEKELTELAKAGEILWQQRCFEPGEIRKEEWKMVLAASNQPELNSRVYEECRKKDIPVNNASNQKECDFFFPAIIRQDEMVMGLVSQGENHGKVRKAAARVRRVLQEGE